MIPKIAPIYLKRKILIHVIENLRNDLTIISKSQPLSCHILCSLLDALKPDTPFSDVPAPLPLDPTCVNIKYPSLKCTAVIVRTHNRELL